jgi:hypothetical protein
VPEMAIVNDGQLMLKERKGIQLMIDGKPINLLPKNIEKLFNQEFINHTKHYALWILIMLIQKSIKTLAILCPMDE